MILQLNELLISCISSYQDSSSILVFNYIKKMFSHTASKVFEKEKKLSIVHYSLETLGEKSLD